MVFAARSRVRPSTAVKTNQIIVAPILSSDPWAVVLQKVIRLMDEPAAQAAATGHVRSGGAGVPAHGGPIAAGSKQLSCGDVGFDNAWKIQFCAGIEKLVNDMTRREPNA
jgi:hypothetical protein